MSAMEGLELANSAGAGREVSTHPRCRRQFFIWLFLSSCFVQVDAILNMANPVFDLEMTSTKIEVVLKEIKKLAKKEEGGQVSNALSYSFGLLLVVALEPSSLTSQLEKVVIVSQWTSMLEIVKIHIKEMGLKLTEIHGKVPIKDRGDIVDNFNKDGKGAQVSICVNIVILVIIPVIVLFIFVIILDVFLLLALSQVMLLSLGAGGVGLNLVGANHLFLLDCHWNPQVGWLIIAMWSIEFFFCIMSTLCLLVGEAGL